MKVLALIENDMYVRNFISSGAFDPLLNKHDFGIYVSEAVIKLRDKVPSEKIRGTYQRNPANTSLVYKFNKISMLANKKQCSTFRIKAEAGWYGRYSLKAKFGAHPIVFERWTKSYLKGRLEPNSTLEEIIRKENPQLVLFPITGVEATGYELVRLSQKYSFKTLFLVNGWDNLSSKGQFLEIPDFLGVWGPQSMIDAVQIQKIPEERLILLGCARYEDYFRNGGEIKVSDLPSKYILFAGATAPNDEISVINILEDCLEQQRGTAIKIVYRPHPWRDKRNCFDFFDPQKYKHVIMDPQVAADYYRNKKAGQESVSSNNYPGLAYYKSLLQNCSFTISAMSSLALEAALFDVPSLILAHDDSCHKMALNRIAQFRHFDGGRNIPGWFYIDDLSQLERVFKSMLGTFSNEDKEHRKFRPALSFSMKRYLHFDQFLYSQRLACTVEAILGKTQSI